MNNIKLPEESLKYILFQRTHYLKDNIFFNFLTSIALLRYIGLVWFHSLSTELKIFFYGPEIKREYNKDIEFEYSTIKDYLLEDAKSVLDIGCGVAGIDVLISKHYSNNINIFLIDKTYTNKKIYYGFKRKASFYNSLDISKNVLELNGVSSDNIFIQEANDDNSIDFKESFDIVISLISWGFHYPVFTYLDSVYDKLNQNGILIIDVKKLTGGEKEIEKKFGNYKVIFENKEMIRVLAKKG